MRTFIAMVLALSLVGCGDAPSKDGGETPPETSAGTPSDAPAEEASAQKTLRVEYYEINKK